MAAAAEDDVSMAAAAAASAAMDAGDGDDEAMTLEVVPAPVASEAQMARAVELKDRGNAFFKEKRYASAIDLYDQSLGEHLTAAVLGNRSFAHLKMENFGLAIADATRALELDPTFSKGFYRRGSALMALGKYKDARREFRALVKLMPRDPDARKQLEACEKEVRREAFEKAIASERTESALDALDAQLASMEVPSSYAGPRLPASGEVTVEYAATLMEFMRGQTLPPKRDVWVILQKAHALLKAQPSLVRVAIPEDGGCVTVMGDTHGQYYDTLNIFRLAGHPSPSNIMLFNGDFVDRGSFSVENVLALLVWRLAAPAHFHMLRGNHESATLNKVYGFEGEVRHKYCDKTMQLFADVFRALPLAAVLGSRALVVHGGIFSRDGVTLDDISGISRFREPPETGLMSDILWSDPQPFEGWRPSKRGVGRSFGPDVTARFLDANGLEFLIRSHEVKDEGYLVEHHGRCITIFSAPNYCDQVGNKGAFLRIRRTGDIEYTQYAAVPHPHVPPMAYAGTAGLLGLGM